MTKIFTPEDCLSCQFSPSINIEGDCFSFIQNLINTRYVEASLRSLKITSQHINDEQLHFILSNLRRITSLELDLEDNYNITSGIVSGIRSIGENLTELKFSYSRAVDAFCFLHHFASNLRKLTKLVLFSCDAVRDDCVLEISKFRSIRSLSIMFCGNIGPEGFDCLASMTELIELNVSGSRFNDDDQQFFFFFFFFFFRW
jgi:hypothetical protein